MKKRLRQWLPSPESIRSNRWLRWMGPTLQHPRLWHLSRKGVAMGLAVGIFFGFLVPVAQIPLAAAAAVALRANLPMAVASTLVTNPVTFAPVYFAAYKTGQAVLGRSPAAANGAVPPLPPGATEQDTQMTWAERLATLWEWLTNAGKPLVVGLAIFASAGGLLAYGITSLVWALYVRRSRSQRLRQRDASRDG